jgi:hypothetical protein
MVQPVAIDPNAIARVKGVVDDLLNQGYYTAVGDTLQSIGVGANRGQIKRDLDALRVEAQRLAALNESLNPDNPVLRTFYSDLDDFMRSSVVLIDGSAEALQNVGIETAYQSTRWYALGNISDEALQLTGVQWNRPDAAALQSIIQYVDSDAWQTSLSNYRGYVPQLIKDTIVRDFVMGVNPMTTVDNILFMTQGRGDKPPLTVSSAESLTRSLVLTAHRDSQVLQQVANADIIDYVIRIAALDFRTCLSCIALHGTRLEVGERVDDHRRGRCQSLSIVKGRPRSVQMGEDWFNNLSEESKRDIMGGANYRAYDDGAVTLQDFVHRGSDPVFGDIVQENSLKGILGDAAQRYYERNQ